MLVSIRKDREIQLHKGEEVEAATYAINKSRQRLSISTTLGEVLSTYKCFNFPHPFARTWMMWLLVLLPFIIHVFNRIYKVIHKSSS